MYFLGELNPEFVLLRSLRQDLLPGKCFYLQPPKVIDEHNLISSIGKKKKSGNQTVNKNPIIKRSGLTGGDNLILQVTSELQREEPPSGSLRLWLSPSREPLEVWPPLETVFYKGSLPNVSHLKRHLSEMSGVSFDDIIVFKYQVNSGEWLEFLPNMKTNNKKSAKKASDNILQAPFSLSSGDLIAFSDRKKAVMNAGSLERAEDVYFKNLLARIALNKVASQSKKMKSGNKYKAVPEVALKFGISLDFSSAESESDDENC